MVNTENMVYDIIKFCIKWGIWDSVLVFTKGKEFCSFDYGLQGVQGFRDLSSVWVMPYDPADADFDDEDKDILIPKILSMLYEGETGLAYLVGSGTYKAKMKYVFEEVFDFIVEQEDLMSNYDDFQIQCNGIFRLEPILNELEFDSYEAYKELESEIDDERIDNIKFLIRAYDFVNTKNSVVSNKVLVEFHEIFQKYKISYRPHPWGLNVGLYCCIDNSR